MKKKATIIGTGTYVPKKILTNQDLEKMVDTSDEWIQTRTGIQERRIAEKEEYTSTMGLKAAQKALKDANLTSQDMDLILCATLSPDYLFPSTACILQDLLQCKPIAAFDIQAACSGYIYALEVARAFVESNLYRNVLIVASEKLSSIVDYEDRATCVLFGDGAAACVVSSEGKGFTIESVVLGSDGSQAELLMLPAGGCRNPTSAETLQKKKHYIHMQGKEVYKHAVRRMEASCKQCLEKAQIKEEEISWVIPHQANVRIIDAIAKRFQHLPKERIVKTVDRFGNTSCSSIGLAFEDLLKTIEVRAKERILCTAFGSGFTFGSCIIQKT